MLRLVKYFSEYADDAIVLWRAGAPWQFYVATQADVSERADRSRGLRVQSARE